MKFFLLLAAFVATASAVSYQDVLLQEFDLYKAEYGKSYETPLENSRRFEIFMQSKYEVAEHNLKFKNGEVTYEMEINKFADWFPEEFEKMNGFNRGGDALPEIDGELYEPAVDDDNVPSSFNWVEKGAVSPVRNQGYCGSCYAFSALGALETQHFLKTNKMMKLSEQEIVDCSGNFGCNGGLTSIAYDYIIKNKGINSEEYYPYEGRQAMCRFDSDYIAATCSKYRQVSMKEKYLKNAVALKGTISTGMHAMESLMKYKGGIYDEPRCGDTLNHAVLVVGYGTDPNTKQDYWIIKNSWGTGWGENGYFRMARNKDNMCGIANFALYPRV